MTTFEAMVEVSYQLLVHRGEWQGSATAFSDMDFVANRVCDLLEPTLGDNRAGWANMVTAELRRKAKTRPAVGDVIPHIHTWRLSDNPLIDRCDICGEERA